MFRYDLLTELETQKEHRGTAACVIIFVETYHTAWRPRGLNVPVTYYIFNIESGLIK